MHGVGTFRLALGVALLVTGSISGIWGALVHWEMVDKLNERLPVERRFNPLWWGPIKRARFLHEYEQLFPNDGPKKRRRRLIVAMFLCSVALALDIFI